MPGAARESLDLAPARSSPREARLFVDAVLHRWGRDGAIDRLGLIASELVTNAVVHTAAASVRVCLEALDVTVRIEVSTSGGRGAASPPAGFSLPIVEALATAWGIGDSDNTKCVWAEVRG